MKTLNIVFTFPNDAYECRRFRRPCSEEPGEEEDLEGMLMIKDKYCDYFILILEVNLVTFLS